MSRRSGGAAQQHHARKFAFPIYASVFYDSQYFLVAGGGGKKSSGIRNLVTVSSFVAEHHDGCGVVSEAITAVATDDDVIKRFDHACPPVVYHDRKTMEAVLYKTKHGEFPVKGFERRDGGGVRIFFVDFPKRDVTPGQLHTIDLELKVTSLDDDRSAGRRAKRDRARW